MSLNAEVLGLDSVGRIHHNLDYEQLFAEELRRQETRLTVSGAMAVDTGRFTGRSPRDKYFVQQPPSSDQIAWGQINQALSPATFEQLETAVRGYLSGRDLYITDGWCGANPATRRGVRFITEYAWQSHFCRNMFIAPTAEEAAGFVPDFTVYNASSLNLDCWRELGLGSEVFIAFNIERKLALIGGTSYGGEMKKGLFTLMNYWLPLEGVLPMHCAANVGRDGDVGLFFGLSGTGKTTLSTDPVRHLIGDDEHGWDDSGVFNFEGGCYAKTINLDPTSEPEIFRAIRRNALLENVAVNAQGHVDFSDSGKTENTRCSYPIRHIDNHLSELRGGHPRNILFLCCDAFGVLPPVSRLTPEQAMYYFLSGYTAKVAGTERGVDTPQATFSACFGEAFLPLHPTVYARLLGEKMRRHGTRAFLVNTGWSGGGPGVGKRMRIAITRGCLDAIFSGTLEAAPFDTLPVFGLNYPRQLPGIPAELLNPRNAWSDPAAYDASACQLAEMFRANFDRYCDGDGGSDIAAAGPRPAA